MKPIVPTSVFLLSSLFGQVGVVGEANTAFDEPSQEKAKTQEHMQAIDGVAAVVGERVVLKSDINQTLAMAIFQQRLNPQKDLSKIEGLKKEITKSIVNRKVVLAMAELDSVEVSNKEVDRALDQQVNNIVAQAGSEEAAEKAIGQPLRTFRREYWYEIKDMLITQKYQQALIGNVSVSKKDVKLFYKTYKDSIPAFPTTIKLRHLLLKVVPSKKQEDKTVAFLEDLRKRILDKKNTFEELATQYSQDPGSKKSEGSLGFVRRGSLVTPFEAVAFTLGPGEISNPVKTEFGYHIIETQEVRGDRIKVRHILMSAPVTDADESIAYKKAVAIKDSSTTISLFLDMINKHTMDEQTKKTGGSLGWINPQTYPVPEFGAVLDKIEKGVCAGPVRSELGYHLLWVESIKIGGAASLQKHWNEVEALALNKKKALWFEGWVADARKNFFIHINK
jgi:peptidyl-prolyl cis-trans isomerase SurA